MMKMLKTTALGGIVFLLPFGILLLILHEIVDFMLKFAEPVASLFQEDDYVGISLAGGFAVIGILLTCFLAGLAAHTAALSGFSSKTDQFLSDLVPGYGMIRTRIAAAMNSEEFAASRQVVTVHVGGLRRYAFLIEEKHESGEALIFLPAAPNAETGVLGFVPLSDLTLVDVPAHKIHRAFQFYGRGL